MRKNNKKLNSINQIIIFYFKWKSKKEKLKKKFDIDIYNVKILLETIN